MTLPSLTALLGTTGPVAPAQVPVPILSPAPVDPVDPVEIDGEVEVPTPVKVALRVKGTKDTMSKVLGALNRRRGLKGAVSSYTRSTQSVMSAIKYVIKLGIRSFDEGTGGLPFGKVVEIYGLDSSGKTALAMLACGAASQGEIYEIMSDGSQKKLDVPFEITVLYLDNENSLEEGSRLIVYDQEVDCIAGECDTIDQIFKDIETVCDSIGEIQAADEAKAKKDKTFTAPLQFIVVVVDTVAGTSTREEVKQDWSKQDYKRQPQQLRDGFRNTIRRLKDFNVCAIFTNQVGDSFKPKPRGMKANVSMLPQEGDFSSFGGKALRYYAHLRIFVCKTPYPYKLTQGKFPDGFVIHFFTAKNRFRMPLRSGRMVLMFNNAMCVDESLWLSKIRPARLEGMIAREKAKGNKNFTIVDAEKFFPQTPPGGYSPVWSDLEHLVYMGFITKTATGGYKINFAKHGISSSAAPAASLEQLDTDLDREEGDIELESKLDWPAFHRSHKREIDVLFERCVQKMFTQNGVGTEAEGDEMALDEDLVEE